MLYQRMMHEVYTAQRAALVELRNSRAISADVMRRIEHEIDLEETRLEVWSPRRRAAASRVRASA